MFSILMGLLSEDSKISSLRFMSILCVLAAVGVACYGISHSKDLLGIAAVVTAFLGPAFTAKVLSKPVEKGNP